ncbi:BON domain-containing protein [Halochromatium glycolicum]|nr:BON domain-containing protein [Halochromatium glycolicum]
MPWMHQNSFHWIIGPAPKALLAFRLLAVLLVCSLAPTVQAQSPDDESIATGVRQALANHPALNDEQITVVVRDGIVELSGYVDSRYERAVADTVTVAVEGVRAVDNLLEQREMPEPVGVDAEAEPEPEPEAGEVNQNPIAVPEPGAGYAPAGDRPRPQPSLR